MNPVIFRRLNLNLKQRIDMELMIINGGTNTTGGVLVITWND